MRRYKITGRVGRVLALVLSAAALSIAITRESWMICIALVVLPALAFWPLEMSLGLYAMLAPFDSLALFGNDNGPGSSINWYVGALAAAILLLQGILRKRFVRPPHAALWWGLFVLWAAATMMWAMDPQRSFHRLGTALSLYLLYLIAVSLDFKEHELARIRVLVILGGVMAASVALVQIMHGVGWNYRASVTLGASQTNPNKFAATLIVPFCLAVGGYLSSWSKRGKLLSGLAIVPIGLGLCLSMSRGALIAVAVALVVFVLRYPSSSRIVLSFTTVFVLSIATSPFFLYRLEESVDSRGAGRMDIWQTGLPALRHYGLLGAGVDNFPLAYNKFIGVSQYFRGYDRAPHNIFLQIGVELGVVGLLLLLFAVGSQLRDAMVYKAGSVEPSSVTTVGYEAACWGLLGMGLSQDELWIKAFWVSWMLLAISVGINERHIIESHEEDTATTEPAWQKA
jgi:O-antigen ligase